MIGNRDELVKQELTPAEFEDLGNIISILKNLHQNETALDLLGMGTIKILQSAVINPGNDRSSIVIAFEGDGYGGMDYDKCNKDTVIEGLKQLIAQQTGKTVEIHMVLKNNIQEVDFNSVNLSMVNFDGIRYE